MDIVTGVELECSYEAGDGRTRSRVASMPKERSGGPGLDQSCDWEKHGYDSIGENTVNLLRSEQKWDKAPESTIAPHFLIGTAATVAESERVDMRNV